MGGLIHDFLSSSYSNTLVKVNNSAVNSDSLARYCHLLTLHRPKVALSGGLTGFLRYASRWKQRPKVFSTGGRLSSFLPL